jgi:hypothetical protein
MAQAEAAVAADDRGERAGEAAGVNVACRRQRGTEMGFPYSNTVRDVDSSRARQAEDSSCNMPFRESQQGVTLEPSRPSPIPASKAMAWRGPELTLTIPRPADVRKHPDGWDKKPKETKRNALFVCAAECGEGDRLEGSTTIPSARPRPSNHVHCRCHAAAQARGSALPLLVGAPCVTTCLVKTMMDNCGREHD